MLKIRQIQAILLAGLIAAPALGRTADRGPGLSESLGNLYLLSDGQYGVAPNASLGSPRLPEPGWLKRVKAGAEEKSRFYPEASPPLNHGFGETDACVQRIGCGVYRPMFAQDAHGSLGGAQNAYSFERVALTAAQQLSSGDPKSAALGAARSLLGAGFTDLLKASPGWLKRTEIEFDITKYSKPEFSLLTVQPLFQSKNDLDTFFTQGRFAYGRDADRKTFNLGFGYRRLVLGEGLMLGANTFFDYEAPFDHRRVGMGGEIRSGPLELNVNYYNAISRKVKADGGAHERALDGYDLEMGAQLPYLPWARVFGKYFYWDTVQKAKNVQGKRVGLRLRPFPLAEIEVGYTDDNFNPPATFVHIRVSLGLGRTEQDSGIAKIDEVPFRFTSMKEQTLDKVRRENTIRVERTKPAAAGGTATITISRGT